jgi:precorrin-6A/cobalt-precorrin-6A reductase
MDLLKPFRNPFFSIGQSPIEHIAEIPRSQHWTIRCAHKARADVVNHGAQYTVLESIGPFNLGKELALFQTRKIDVLVTKNSGGNGVSAKLAAARQLDIPVCILKRPGLAKAHREFDNITVLMREILYHSKLHS